MLSMRRCGLVGLAALLLAGTTIAQAADIKTQGPKPFMPRMARDLPTAVLLTNGTGDGKLSVTVDGYGSFGSATSAGDAFFDPAGATVQSRTVYQSGVYFSASDSFFGVTLGSLPAIGITKVSDTTATSRFTLANFSVALTQKITTTGNVGSVLQQTYKITNNTGAEQDITLVRHVDGDLYFNGTYANDYGGVSADGRTLYEFDSGDNQSSPVTYVGITSTGGTPGTFTIQPFRYTDDIIAANGIPAATAGKVYNDTDNNGVTDSTYDITLSQGNSFHIAAGKTVTYKTNTIFGQGSIAETTSAVAGCVKMAGVALPNRTVSAKQPGVATQTTKTDANGCYMFDRLTAGKTFTITIAGPRVTIEE